MQNVYQQGVDDFTVNKHVSLSKYVLKLLHSCLADSKGRPNDSGKKNKGHRLQRKNSKSKQNLKQNLYKAQSLHKEIKIKPNFTHTHTAVSVFVLNSCHLVCCYSRLCVSYYNCCLLGKIELTLDFLPQQKSFAARDGQKEAIVCLNATSLPPFVPTPL